MKALLVGDGTGALAAARELERAGWFVGVASERRWGWASLSRRAARWHQVPEPSGDLSGFTSALNAAVAEEGYELFLPTSDTALIAAMRRAGGAPVLQDYVAGRLVTYVVFADETHRIAAEHFRATLQERMSDTGPIALAESQRVPLPLRAWAERIAAKLGWVGLMSLQFLETREGRFSLIDLNGRIDGEHALTSACGLTGADAWARLATGRSFRLPEVSDTGQRYQAIEAEFLRRLAKPGPKRLSTAWDFLRDGFRAVHLIFQASDPLPALAYFSRRMSSLLKKAGIQRDESGVQPGDPSSGGDAMSPISRQPPPLPRVGAR
jgi:hypothetical protein